MLMQHGSVRHDTALPPYWQAASALSARGLARGWDRPSLCVPGRHASEAYESLPGCTPRRVLATRRTPAGDGAGLWQAVCALCTWQRRTGACHNLCLADHHQDACDAWPIVPRCRAPPSMPLRVTAAPSLGGLLWSLARRPGRPLARMHHPDDGPSLSAPQASRALRHPLACLVIPHGRAKGSTGLNSLIRRGRVDHQGTASLCAERRPPATGSPAPSGGPWWTCRERPGSRPSSHR